jgi:hypothetical protein
MKKRPDREHESARPTELTGIAAGKQARTESLVQMKKGSGAGMAPPVLASPGSGVDMTPRADQSFVESLLGAPPVQMKPVNGVVQMQSADDAGTESGTPGYIEETGFGSLKQTQENMEKYRGSAETIKVGDNDEEYIPDLGAPEAATPGKSPEEIGYTDLDETFEENDVLRERVSDASDMLDIDPGLLAATLFAEDSRASTWSKTSGTVASEQLGLDDYFDPQMAKWIKKVLKDHPEIDFKYSDIKATGEMWDTSTEKAGGAAKPRGELDSKKAVIAAAVYQKAQEMVLRNVIDRERKKHADWPELDALQPDQKLTLMRLAFNAGIVPARNLYRKLAKGGDIARKGGTQRNRKKPGRTAALHTARAIHLSQHVFGRDADDYRPHE